MHVSRVRVALCALLLLGAALCRPVLAQQRVAVRQVEERSNGAVFELTATWPMSLSATLDSADASALTVAAARAVTEGILRESQTLRLPALAAPQVQVLAADYDEVRLPAEEAPPWLMQQLNQPSADVVGLGLERKQPAATLVLQLLRYRPEQGVLRRYRRLRVAVEYGQSVSASRQGTPAPDNPHLTVEESVLADGTVLKFPVTREGIYRIDRGTLESMLAAAGTERSPEDIEPNRLKLYGNGGAPLPALNSAPRPAGLIENPVQVQGGGDGSFDEGDALLFYADDLTGWNYHAEDETWTHYVNPYANKNYYFLKLGGDTGQRVGEGAFPDYSDATSIRQVTGRHVVDIEEYMWSPGPGDGTGRTWVSNTIDAGMGRAILQDAVLPGLAGGEVQYQARVAIHSRPAATVSFESGGRRLESVRGNRIPDVEEPPVARPEQATFTQTVEANAPINLSMRLQQQSNPDLRPEAAVDWVRVFYPKALRADDGMLRFTTPAGQAGRFEMVLRGFEQAPQVWDVTEPGAVRRLGVRDDGSNYRVQVEVNNPDQPRRLVAFTDDAMRSLEASAHRVAPQNLHDLQQYPDFVIVVPNPDTANFREPAQELAERRRQDGLQVLVTSVDQIYNEFSGGVPDMRAMRDYFKFLYDRAPNEEQLLRYALLFGDGHVNYRRLGAVPPELENLIFPYETKNSFDPEESYTSDDYFGLLDDEEGQWPWPAFRTRPVPPGEPVERVDIGIGRLNVQTPAQAQAMVDKVKRFERADAQGPWRTRYTLVADDGPTGAGADENNYDLHVQNAEAAAEIVKREAPQLNLDKIYGPAYSEQRVYLGGYRIPPMNQDIKSALNNGTLVLNYSGHGGPTTLAQENIFTREDAWSLNNRDRLPLFITATCSFGWWDQQSEQTGAEALLLNPEGGAVGILTTVRTVYTTGRSTTTLNVGLNREINEQMFRRGPDGRPRRLGDALRTTKNSAVGLEANNRKFNLLGDPTLRVGQPRYRAQVTRVNGTAVDEQSAQLRALDRLTVDGAVQTQEGQMVPDFSGRAYVSVYDKERKVSLPYQQYLPRGYYRVRNDLIWRGEVDVANGQFSATFRMPKDISYSNEPGRITVYATTGERDDAGGFTENVRIGGTAEQIPDDGEGPQIALFLNDTTFVSGGLTNTNPDLIAKLYDESGINAVGAGVGHKMLMVVDGDEQNAVEIGRQFESEQNSYQRGVVRYALEQYPEELENGPHSLEVTAWDVLNNSSTARLEFTISDSEELEVERIYNVPNPTTGPTRFIIEHNQPTATPADVQVRIYTLAGRPVRTIDHEDMLLTSGPVQIRWEGRDADLDQLAPGIYLYKVRVEIEAEDGGRQVAERIEKLAVVR